MLPLLEAELGPGVAATLARTGEQLRTDMEALDDLAEARLATVRSGAGPELSVNVDALRSQPTAILGRVLRLAALEAGSRASELFAVHVEALSGLVLGTLRGEVQLPGHVTAYRSEDHLRFRRTAVGG